MLTSACRLRHSAPKQQQHMEMLRWLLLLAVVLLWHEPGLTAASWLSARDSRRQHRSAAPVQRPPRKQLGSFWRQPVGLSASAALWPPEAAALQEQYVAICTAAKNQHEDVAEWLDHHLALGVSKVYLYDDRSSPPMLAKVGSYVSAGLMEYTYVQDFWHPSNRTQLYVYDRCIAQHREQHQWLAFIDLDEFLVLTNPAATASLPALLHEFESEGGLAVHWRIFGSSGHVQRPAMGTLAAYRKCLPTQASHNQHIKTIANTRHVVAVGRDPHTFEFLPPARCVNEWHIPVPGARATNVSMDRIALHHYVTKSFDEYQAKMERGSAMQNHKTTAFFQEIESMSMDTCFIPAKT